MANVLEIARASITAFNEKDWNRIRALYTPDAVYDEKATTAASKARIKSSRP